MKYERKNIKTLVLKIREKVVMIQYFRRICEACSNMYRPMSLIQRSILCRH